MPKECGEALLHGHVKLVTSVSCEHETDEELFNLK
jgi:hypothetical protein